MKTLTLNLGAKKPATPAQRRAMKGPATKSYYAHASPSCANCRNSHVDPATRAFACNLGHAPDTDASKCEDYDSACKALDNTYFHIR